MTGSVPSDSPAERAGGSERKQVLGGGVRTMFERIVVPVDGSPPSRDAVAAAVALARAFGGRVRFVYVLDVERIDAELTVWTGGHAAVFDDIRNAARAALDDSASAAASGGVQSETGLLQGDVVTQLLLDATEWKADVFVIGTHGRAEGCSPALGSKTAELLRRVTIPVLVVR